MVKKYCETCNEELTNPRFILSELTTLGYEEKNFCSKIMCFVKYVVKKFKRKIRKVLNEK